MSDAHTEVQPVYPPSSDFTAQANATDELYREAEADRLAFPLFLIARELRMKDSDAPRLRTTDMILLMLLAIGMVGLTIWVVAP
jgi:hypothetical protein